MSRFQICRWLQKLNGFSGKKIKLLYIEWLKGEEISVDKVQSPRHSKELHRYGYGYGVLLIVCEK